METFVMLFIHQGSLEDVYLFIFDLIKTNDTDVIIQWWLHNASKGHLTSVDGFLKTGLHMDASDHKPGIFT